ncbi:EH domain-containing protein 1 [Nilaparvata lugens]|uniref:EH domain-containing protein 1 n=1 Tax=Nilaparvata lugens TaxID=108931 RepID=UPI00193E0ADD|nr:EH domain-containing protein 1 [Nilaparvata lugens]
MVTTSEPSASVEGDGKNITETDLSPINAEILMECHKLYTCPEKGLIGIGKEFKLNFLAPRKKVIILLIGNHSAGKSSFINWYIGERFLKTGVAIETQGFTLVTSGKKRESLGGTATLHLDPRFKALEDIRGVVDFLSTEISTSTKRCFNLVTFVDTPGLVDGEVHYPYAMEEAVNWLGGIADQIIVFFDPIGQALCRRTLNTIEQLNQKHAEKIQLYLSKADDAGDEADRQKVMMQIVQELCKRPSLNRNGFSMPAIYLPDKCRPTDCKNQIEVLCTGIENLVTRNVQMALNNLEKDCKSLESAIETALKKDDENISHNSSTSKIAAVITFVLYIIAATCILPFFMARKDSRSITTLMDRWGKEPDPPQPSIVGPFFVSLVVAYIFYYNLKEKLGLKPTLAWKKRKYYLSTLQYIKETVSSKSRSLFREYLQQSIDDPDLLSFRLLN